MAIDVAREAPSRRRAIPRQRQRVAAYEPPPSPEEITLRRRSWEVLAQASIDHVRDTAERADLHNGDETAVPTRRAACEQVKSQLRKAEDYLAMSASLLTAARGTRLDGAWSHIHNAKVASVELMGDDQLAAYVPEILALATKNLTRGTARIDEPALATIRALHKKYSNGGPPEGISDRDRHTLSNVLRTTYDRVANEFHRLRRFQAAVVVATIFVLLLVAGLMVLGAARPASVPLCFPDPSATVQQPVANATPVCPSGTDAPAPADVALVALFGLVGAALVGVRLAIRPSTPSSVPMATTRWFQGLLKAATGMLTAILGLMFLRAGIVPGFDQVDTQAQILVYAVVFGASQELITRFVDERSNTLLAAVTATEPTPNEGDGSEREY